MISAKVGEEQSVGQARVVPVGVKPGQLEVVKLSTAACAEQV